MFGGAFKGVPYPRVHTHRKTWEFPSRSQVINQSRSLRPETIEPLAAQNLCCYYHVLLRLLPDPACRVGIETRSAERGSKSDSHTNPIPMLFHLQFSFSVSAMGSRKYVAEDESTVNMRFFQSNLNTGQARYAAIQHSIYTRKTYGENSRIRLTQYNKTIFLSSNQASHQVGTRSRMDQGDVIRRQHIGRISGEDGNGCSLRFLAGLRIYGLGIGSLLKTVSGSIGTDGMRRSTLREIEIEHATGVPSSSQKGVTMMVEIWRLPPISYKFISKVTEFLNAVFLIAALILAVSVSGP